MEHQIEAVPGSEQREVPVGPGFEPWTCQPKLFHKFGNDVVPLIVALPTAADQGLGGSSRTTTDVVDRHAVLQAIGLENLNLDIAKSFKIALAIGTDGPDQGFISRQFCQQSLNMLAAIIISAGCKLLCLQKKPCLGRVVTRRLVGGVGPAEMGGPWCVSPHSRRRRQC